MPPNATRPRARGASQIATSDADNMADAETCVKPAVEWMTRAQTAAYLQISLPTLDRVKPPRHMVGASPRFRRSEIDEWLASQSGGASCDR